MIKQTQRSRAGQRGFTLVEVMVSLGIMSILFLGTIDLYIGAMRSSVKTQAQIFSSQDASNALQKVISQLREAQSFAVSSDGTTTTVPPPAATPFLIPSGTTASQFTTAYNSESINTAIEITSPPALTPAADGYPSGATTIRVQSSTGYSTSYHVIAPYQSNGTTTTTTALIYRGDVDGTPDSNPPAAPTSGPDPLKGTYLWQYTIPANGAFVNNSTANPPNPAPLCKSVSVAPDAVQFVRPTDGSTAQAYQVECKIISGYYSPIGGTDTNEMTNGSATSQLTGKCVYMRDHSTAGAPSNANHQTSNNAFKYY